MVLSTIKNIIILPIFFFFPFLMFGGQDSLKTKISCKIRHEFGLSIFSMTNFQRFNSSIGPNNIYNDFDINYNFFPGFYYKKYFLKNIFRSSTDYIEKVYQTFGNNAYNGTKKSVEIKLKRLQQRH